MHIDIETRQEYIDNCVLVERIWLSVLGYSVPHVPVSEEEVAEEEQITGHEIVALCRILQRRWPNVHVHKYLTSEDTISVARTLMWTRRKDIISKLLGGINLQIYNFVCDTQQVTCARTHGQPAGPINWSSIFSVYQYQLDSCLERMPTTLRAKFGGVVGRNHTDLPDIDFWSKCTTLCSHLNVTREIYTTQVSSRIDIVSLLQCLQLLACVFQKICVDLWIRGSHEECSFVSGDIGSSAIPWKANPWKFESAEGHFEQFVQQVNIPGLLCSRLERDLSDSVVQRDVVRLLDLFIAGLRRFSSAFTTLTLHTTNATTPVLPHSTQHWQI